MTGAKFSPESEDFHEQMEKEVYKTKIRSNSLIKKMQKRTSYTGVETENVAMVRNETSLSPLQRDGSVSLWFVRLVLA